MARSATSNLLATTLIVLAASASAYAGGQPAIDPAWRAKAQAGIKAVLEKYDTLAPRLEEVAEYRAGKAPGPKGIIPFVPQTRREHTVCLGDYVIKEEMRFKHDTPNKKTFRLLCDNKDYHFTLAKFKEDADYVLAEYAPGQRKLPLVKQGPGLYADVFDQLRGALQALEKQPKYVLKGVRFDDGKRLLRIEYKFDSGGAKSVHVDPEQDWRVVEYGVETPSLVATTKVTYGETVGGLTFPTGFRNLTTYKVAEAPPNLDITGKVISLKLTDKSEADFYLSAFGLPEPVGFTPPTRSRWYLWFIAGGALALLVGGYFGYRSRRRKSELAQTSPTVIQGNAK